MKDYNLTYDWLDFIAEHKKVKNVALKEATLRNFVSGRNAKLAQVVGAIDLEVVNTGGSYGDSIKFGDGNTWIAQNITTVTLINGGRAQFHRRFADQLKKAFETACRATGWTPENPNNGYCPKPNGGFVQRRSRAPSEMKKPVDQRQIGGHAWGTSIDLGSATENPMGGGGKIRQFPQFINAMKQGGFIWGGDWSNKDDMHFEVSLSGETINMTNDTINTTDAPREPEDRLGKAIFGDVELSSSTNTDENDTHEDEDSSNINESINKKLFYIKDNSKNKIHKNNKKYFDSLLMYLKKELKITKPVKIVFEDDEKNSKKVLGRTGGYTNEENKIHIFVTGRHIKDIMRSLAHEMVHHRQNIRGEFDKNEPTIHGYAQKNPHLRKMEKEAFLKGNMLFRDWEDNYKYRGDSRK